MSTTTIETVIIGAGQAGLSTAYQLLERDHDCVVLDANHRVGDNWRRQWDSLRLYSPARYDGLPGYPFPAPGWSFPGKDSVGEYLESYARRFDLPVRLNTRVESVDADGNGGFGVRTGSQTISCRNVVVATGTFGRTPNIPDCAADLDPSILQLHSSEYRRPAQLRDGPTLVVGASHSGFDIAYEVAESHPTVLCGRDCGSLPFRPESPHARLVFPIVVFAWRHVLTRRTPIGRKEMPKIRHHGAPALRVKNSDLRKRGVRRIEQRVTGSRGGMPELADGEVLDVANIVWCTGFRQVFDWIHLPVLGDDGWPEEMRGVVDTVPGLYFCGLAFQYAFSSMVLPGVGRDAAYIADRIAERAAQESTMQHQPA